MIDEKFDERQPEYAKRNRASDETDLGMATIFSTHQRVDPFK